MIQIFTFTVAMAGDLELARRQIEEGLQRVAERHRTLRGLSVATDDDTLRVVMRVSSHDRWRGSADARRIVAVILRRAKLDWQGAMLESVQIERNGHSVTKDEGRPGCGKKRKRKSSSL